MPIGSGRGCCFGSSIRHLNRRECFPHISIPLFLVHLKNLFIRSMKNSQLIQLLLGGIVCLFVCCCFYCLCKLLFWVWYRIQCVKHIEWLHLIGNVEFIKYTRKINKIEFRMWFIGWDCGATYIYCLWYHKFGAEIEEGTGAHSSAKEIKLIYHIIFIKSNRTIGMANGAASRSKSLWIVVYKRIPWHWHKQTQNYSNRRKNNPKWKAFKKPSAAAKCDRITTLNTTFSPNASARCVNTEHCAHAWFDMYIVHNRPHLSIWRVF